MDYVFEALRIIISWPVLALVVILMYRKEVRKLIGRLKKAWVFEWGDVPSDKIPEKTEESKSVTASPETLKPEKSPIKLKNVANIFWVGHDLMWVYDAILRNAPGSSIVHGLKQSLHHIRELGLKDNPIEQKLAKMLQEAEETPDEDWHQTRRGYHAGEVLSIRDHLGGIINKQQRDFRGRP